MGISASLVFGKALYSVEEVQLMIDLDVVVVVVVEWFFLLDPNVWYTKIFFIILIALVGLLLSALLRSLAGCAIGCGGGSTLVGRLGRCGLWSSRATASFRCGRAVASERLAVQL